MNYKTAHELARELLAGPNLIIAIAIPMAEPETKWIALSVKTGVDCIVFSPISMTIV